MWLLHHPFGRRSAAVFIISKGTPIITRARRDHRKHSGIRAPDGIIYISDHIRPPPTSPPPKIFGDPDDSDEAVDSGSPIALDPASRLSRHQRATSSGELPAPPSSPSKNHPQEHIRLQQEPPPSISKNTSSRIEAGHHESPSELFSSLKGNSIAGAAQSEYTQSGADHRGSKSISCMISESSTAASGLAADHNTAVRRTIRTPPLVEDYNTAMKRMMRGHRRSNRAAIRQSLSTPPAYLACNFIGLLLDGR